MKRVTEAFVAAQKLFVDSGLFYLIEQEPQGRVLLRVDGDANELSDYVNYVDLRIDGPDYISGSANDACSELLLSVVVTGRTDTSNNHIFLDLVSDIAELMFGDFFTFDVDGNKTGCFRFTGVPTDPARLKITHYHRLDRSLNLRKTLLESTYKREYNV